MSFSDIQFKHDIKEYLSERFTRIMCDLDVDCDERRGIWFNKLLETLPIPPAYTIVRVNELLSHRDEVQQLLQERINKQYEQKRVKPPAVIPHPLLRDVLVIPSGHRDDPEVKPESIEVIVDLACGMAVLRGAEIFAPGVMAAPVVMNRGDTVAVYSDVKGLCRRGMTAKFEGERLFLGNGKAVLSRHDIFVASSSGTAVVMTDPVFDCPSLNSILPSKIFLQNLPSILVGHILNPQPGEKVLDMCAAPGGKTTHIATLMKDQGTVVALDRASKKIARIEANAAALHLKCINAYCFDGTKACITGTEMAEGKGDCQPPFPRLTFDRVLLDAPCSGLGQRPRIYSKMSLSEIKSYPALQRKLFSSAVSLLQEGGTLVYSTCTITIEENESLVVWALQKHPEMRLEKQEPHLGGPGLPVPGLSREDQQKVQRFTPTSHLASSNRGRTVTCDNDTIGFFVAKFVKLTTGDR
ncbi:tRNA (cytosine(72)-C(5))-methyltransferase NSUN6-like [Lytechinus pictus]|uniref:tRNA (cytosine(72)-C(5))-methyltransferase NSUN6-like n=1 Tax=Lytechinus pictus TaxID=7653 RepID=UPI0030B9C61F